MADHDLHPGTQAMAGGSHGFLAKVYFHAKPFIPRPLRWMLRRGRSPRILKRNAKVWPINEEAGQKPPGWSGWPDGKQFALVLTHDVESADGLARVKDLANLELEYGFHSSFNLIPKGTYEDPKEIRAWLDANGFEVGVHDLNHDGLLYESRETFRRKADDINSFLRKWNAVGFRSGFMLRQLEWLHDLNIVYDTSTFDTDPFEPQPEGSLTIFPFIVEPSEHTAGRGYVELSYTLPQDSTLFLLLREKTPEIWKRKLDWIASRGGMALVNIHPDYVHFGNGEASGCYSHNLIREFFDYIQKHYADAYWNPLAKELANWYKSRANLNVSPQVTPSSPTPPL